MARRVDDLTRNEDGAQDYSILGTIVGLGSVSGDLIFGLVIGSVTCLAVVVGVSFVAPNLNDGLVPVSLGMAAGITVVWLWGSRAMARRAAADGDGLRASAAAREAETQRQIAEMKARDDGK